MKNIYDYWIKKLLFPKKILIDEPGIITNCVMRKYGGVRSRQRVTIFFEEIVSNLQNKSVEILGKDRASKIWYNGGKRAAERYFYLAQAKVLPAMLFDSVLGYVLEGFRSSGFSALKKFEKIKEKIIVSGDSNIICRKTGDSSLMRGFLSGALSSLTGKDFDVVEKCKDCPNGCRFICANKNIEHVPIIKDKVSIEKYNANNFPVVHTIGKRLGTFRNLMKFNKINIKQKNELVYKGKCIIPMENGCFELFMEELKKIGGTKIMEKGIMEEAEKICSSTMESNKTKKEKMNELLNILSAFGWGKPSYKKDDSKIKFKFLNPPINKCGANYLIYFLNGFLNNIFGQKFKFDKTSQSIQPFVLTIDYTS